MTRLRKFWFGLALGLPYLWASYSLGVEAIRLGRDLTATGIMIGAVATGVCGIIAAFVYGNVREAK